MKNTKKTVWDVVRDFKQAEKHFKASAHAWEARNNRRMNEAETARYEKRENDQAEKGAAILAEYGFSCDWPGLYPTFSRNGRTQYDLNGVMSQLEVNTPV